MKGAVKKYLPKDRQEKILKVLVTAGSTKVNIDQARAITNIFRGRTGTNIAKFFSDKGFEVTLATSNQELLGEDAGKIRVLPFHTYDDLYFLLKKEIETGKFDVIVHSAAVSDYKVRRVLDGDLREVDNSGKIRSTHEKLYLELVLTEKIIDNFRKWGFGGKLVKFKFLSAIKDIEALLANPESCFSSSSADILVANCFESMYEGLHVVDKESGEDKIITRDELPETLFKEIIK